MNTSTINTYKFAATTSLIITLILSLLLSTYLIIIKAFLPSQILIISFICFLVCFIVFQYRFKKFIFSRVEKIYNDIIVLETNYNPVQNIPMSTDMDFLTKEIRKYTKLKRLEVESFKAREEFRKEFVGNVAHELKTPLFTVQGYISTLLDGAMDDPEILKKYLKRADKGVDRLIYIVQDLDLITKIEFGDTKLEKSNFDITTLIQNIFEDLEIKAKKKNISLVCNNNTKIPFLVHADKERIQQVLTNLVVNSLKYGHNNGTTEVSVEEMGSNKAIIRVTDNGEGIETEHLPRLFERFYRVDKSGARSEGGSGLGLSIVKHIIDAHEEKIYVESKYGIGSEFSFTLPKVK